MNRVGAVALLLINYVLFLQCFICVGVTNFLHRKFYPANLQYVSLKNLIVLYPLHKKVNLNILDTVILDTYHFLILIFEAAYYEVHRLLIYRLLSGLGG